MGMAGRSRQRAPPSGRRAVAAPLLLLLAAFAGCTARVVDDESLGLTRYDFRGVWNGVPGIAVVHLRTVCVGSTLFVKGALGVITLDTEADKASHYTAPTALFDHNWDVQLQDRSTSTMVRMNLFKTVDKHDNTVSFSQLEAQLDMPGQLELLVLGSPWRHELYLPQCAQAPGAADHPLAAAPGSLLNDRHWVVLPMPRVLGAPVEQYAKALLAHLEYHRSLGFAGTLLLCDLHQSYDLLDLPAVAAASAADTLLLWPWQYELPKKKFQWYWQVPRFQLAALAGWGRATRLAFLDLDDFLLLPAAAAASDAATASSSSSDDAKPVATPSALQRGCLALAQSQGELQAELARAQPSLATDGSGTSEIGARAPPQPPVLRVPRFDARIVSPCASGQDHDACLEQLARWWSLDGAKLEISRCPLRDGGVRASRRPLVVPHDVVAVRSYTAAARGGNLDGPGVEPACAYILHMANLFQPVEPWALKDAASWQVPAGALPGSGTVQFEGLKQGAGLPRREESELCPAPLTGPLPQPEPEIVDATEVVE